VYGDATRLTQVFANLLNNAAKYTEPGGQIRIAVSAQNSEAVVDVEDSGVGIPTPMLAKIFEPFTQVERGLDRSQGGLGIGLTLVQRLVTMHGGSVTAVSDVNRNGSVFSVRLPIFTPNAIVPSRQPSEAAGRVSSRRKILVVDDNIDAAESLALVLRLCGHDVAIANDGPSALERANAFQPDVVLLDIGLPGMDGYEVAQRLRDRPGNSPLSLIALSGYGQEQDRRRAKEAGFHHHFLKPVEIEELFRVIADLERNETSDSAPLPYEPCPSSISRLETSKLRMDCVPQSI
jgi:CheY-like chemotaxis protein